MHENGLTFLFVWHRWGTHDPTASLPEMWKTIFRKSVCICDANEKKRGKQCSQNKSSAQNKHLQDLLSVFSSSFLSSSWSPLMFCVMTNKQSKLYNTSKTLIRKWQLVWNIPVREFFCQQLQKLHHILCKTNKFVRLQICFHCSFICSFYTKVAMRTIASSWCSD